MFSSLSVASNKEFKIFPNVTNGDDNSPEPKGCVGTGLFESFNDDELIIKLPNTFYRLIMPGKKELRRYHLLVLFHND